MDTKSLVLEKFGEQVKCSGHCQEQAQLRFIKANGDVLTCLACAGGYVSKIVAYGSGVNAADFKAFVSAAAKDVREVKDQEIRTATRHPWDLGYEGRSGESLKVAYWNQNYRSKDDNPNRKVLYLCSKCNSLYADGLNNRQTLCQNCR